MNERSWGVFHKHWSVLKPPLLATGSVTAAVSQAIDGKRQHALLLGVTPQLVEIGEVTVALDWSRPMIENIWPGDTPQRRAFEADWRTMPIAERSFTAVIGDGSFNCLRYPDGYRAVFGELERVLVPGARFAVRVYVTPSPGETLAELRGHALAGEVATIDALKCRLGMAVAARKDANVPRGAIYDAFEETFRDRKALAEAAGWDEGDFAAVDWYKDVTDIISFPTADEIEEIIPTSFTNARLVSSGSYAMSERCPILAMDFRP